MLRVSLFRVAAADNITKATFIVARYVFRLSNQGTVPPSRISLPVRSQPIERIAPMRKFLGKLGGGQFQGHSSTPPRFCY